MPRSRRGPAERALATARRTAGDHDERGRRAREGARAGRRQRGQGARRRGWPSSTAAAPRLVEGLSAFTDPVEGVSRLSDRHPDPAVPAPARDPVQDVAGRDAAAVGPGLPRRLPRRRLRGVADRDRGQQRHAPSGRRCGAPCGDEGRERAAWRELVADVRVGPRRLDRPPARAAEPERQARRRGGDGAAHPRRSPTRSPPRCSTTGRPSGRPTATGGRAQHRRAAISTRRSAQAAADAVVANPPVEPRRAGARRVCDDPVAKVTVLQPAGRRVSSSLRTTSWSSAPRVDVLPDRFVLHRVRRPRCAPRSWSSSATRCPAPLVSRSRSERRAVASSSSRSAPTPTTPTRCRSPTPALDVRLRARAGGRDGVPVRPDGRPGGAGLRAAARPRRAAHATPPTPAPQTLDAPARAPSLQPQGPRAAPPGHADQRHRERRLGLLVARGPRRELRAVLQAAAAVHRAISDPHETRDGQRLADAPRTARLRSPRASPART